MPFENDVKTLNGVAALLDEARMLYDAACMVLPDGESQQSLKAAVAVREALCLRLRDQVGALGARVTAPSPSVGSEDMAICRLLAQGEHDAARCGLNAADARLREAVGCHARSADLTRATIEQLLFTAQILDVAPLLLAVTGQSRSVAA